MANQVETPGQLAIESNQQSHEGNQYGMQQSMASIQYQQLAHPAAQPQLSHHADGSQSQGDQHRSMLGQNYYMGQGISTQAMENVAVVAGTPSDEPMALQVSVPAKYVCTCGCLQKRYLAHPEELEALEAEVNSLILYSVGSIVCYGLNS